MRKLNYAVVPFTQLARKIHIHCVWYTILELYLGAMTSETLHIMGCMLGLD